MSAKKAEARRLVCDRCNHVLTMQVSENPEAWPLHRCRATNRPEPFTRWTEIPPLPQRVDLW